MPLKLISSECWIMLRRLQDADGKWATYLFCQSKQRGLPCPRDTKSGKKVYEICSACFENMNESDFLNQVIYPGLLTPQTGRVEPTLADLAQSGEAKIIEEKNRVMAEEAEKKEKEKSSKPKSATGSH